MSILQFQISAGLFCAVACQSQGATPKGWLSVHGSSVRACDLVLVAPGKLKAALSESAIVRVHQIRSRVALSFANTSDDPFTVDFLELQWDSETRPAIELLESTCYDRAGRVIADAKVTIGE